MDVAREYRVDLVVIGPEVPLVAGLTDELTQTGMCVFGPSQRAARLEGSKAFAKDFALRHGIRTARHITLSDPARVERAVGEFSEPPVVKADGLCAGKGVVVAESHQQAGEIALDMLSGHRFGVAGKTVVLEERLQGAEVSVHAITDGESLVVLPSAQDHKRIGEGDTGPNTGGMGAYAPAPLLTDELARRVRTEVLEPAVRGMAAEGCPYRGVLYAQIMVTPDSELYLVEFNARFGDPETQVLVNVMEGDLGDALEAAARGNLREDLLVWNQGHAVCVVLAAPGYPESTSQDETIDGVEDARKLPGVNVYHSGTRLDGRRLVTAGGRILGVTARGETLEQARDRAYQAADRVQFAGKRFRRDIAGRALGR
jgi:phosphoribosylamine--glycine ligase